MIRKSLIIILSAMTTTPMVAQKMKLIEGDLAPLKGQTEVKTEFTYENMIVGKDLNEKDYIADKKKAYDEKEPGRGEKWEKAWYSDRKDRFEPQFRELFAKHSGMSAVGENAPYTLIFKTTRTEPGFNVGVVRRPAFIDGEAWIVDSKDKNKVIAKISIKNVPGSQFGGFDFDTGTRLQESYAKAGKEIGAFIKKATKK